MTDTVFPNQVILEKLNDGRISVVMYDRKQELLKTCIESNEYLALLQCDDTFGCKNYSVRREGFKPTV